MSESLLDRYIRQVIESQIAPQVTIASQRGEPTLMGVDFFHRAVALAESGKRPGQTLQHTIQTNATLLTPEWCELFRQHEFLVASASTASVSYTTVTGWIRKAARPSTRSCSHSRSPIPMRR